MPSGKKQPPKGGVALFGGANMFGGNKNPFAHRRGDSDQEDESETNDTNEETKNFRPSSTYDSLAIQPDAEESGINLDEQPSSEHVISSVLKGRPKIPQKRKLPSKLSLKIESDAGGLHKMPNGIVETEKKEAKMRKETPEGENIERQRLEKERAEKKN